VRVGSCGLDYVEDRLGGGGGALLVGDQCLVVCVVDGAVGAVGRQGREVVLGCYVVGRAPDAGRENDQGFVSEVSQSCCLFG
jgi:hypothetical protein